MHEVGKTWVEAEAHTAEAIDFLEYYCWNMLRLAGPQPINSMPGEENGLYYLPLGVGVVHPPFNFPLVIMAGSTAAAVVTGNTVVVKPSVQVPVVCAKFFEVLAKAGLPAGVANYLPGDSVAIGDLVTTHPLVRFINFTGSAAVGAAKCEKAAKTYPGQRFLRRFIAEMGGKDRDHRGRRRVPGRRRPGDHRVGVRLQRPEVLRLLPCHQIAVDLANAAQVTLATREPAKFKRQIILRKDAHFWLINSGLDSFPLAYWTEIGKSFDVCDSGIYQEALAAGKPDRRPMLARFTTNGLIDSRPTAKAECVP